MGDDAMHETRFRALAEAYGGAIVRWPADCQAAAFAFAEAAPEAAEAILEEACALDAALDAAPIADPGGAFWDAVAASVLRPAPRPGQRSAPRLSLARVGPPARWAAAAAAVLALGATLGWRDGGLTSADDEAWLVAAYGDLDLDGYVFDEAGG